MSAVPDLDLARIRRFCEGRVPAHLQDQLRIEVDVRGKNVTIWERRPLWRQDPDSTWSRVSVAQLRFDPERYLWSLYWSDRNGRWHPYPDLDPGTAEALLAEIDADPTGIFWG